MTLIEAFALKGKQIDAVAALDHDVALAAGAGSGKTKTLVARYVALLARTRNPRSVVAITFTKKAAREMRNRIRQAIHAWVAGDCPPAERDAWAQIEADLDAARIGTIHSLCETILRAHPAEARIDPGFAVLDEGLGATLQAQAVEDTLAWAIQETELAALFDLFETGDLANILTTLLHKRLEASAAFEQDVLALWNERCVGVLREFATQVADAVAELAELARGDLGADAGAKLADAVESLLAEWRAFERALASGDVARAARCVFTIRRAHAPLNVGKRTSRAKNAVRVWRDTYETGLQAWLGGASAEDVAPDSDLEARVAAGVPQLEKLYAHALSAYRDAKKLRHALDFDDLEAGARDLLRLPDIRARWQKQIDAILVDEFQDTNARQGEIVEALAGTGANRGRLFIVGDAKQSIYRFRGADVGVFRNLEEKIRARGGLALPLDRTFRAHDSLVRALNEILATTMARDSRYAVPFAPLSAERQQAAQVAAPYIEFLCGLGDDADAARTSAAHLLAQRLRALHADEKIAWNDMALLFRAATGFPVYEAALERADIPFLTVAGKGFYDRPEIRDLLNLLRALADPWDDLAFAGLLRSPAFGVSDGALYRLRWAHGDEVRSGFRQAIAGDLTDLAEVDRVHVQRAREFVERFVGVVDRVTAAELLKRVLDATQYLAMLAAEDRGARLQRNVDKLLADAQASGIVRVSEFLEYVASLRAAGAREGEAPSDPSANVGGGAVRLMTIHKAKGLEFPVVVLADASRGRPANRDAVLLSSELGLALQSKKFDATPLAFGLAKMFEREQADAEDVRLLYVAVTRACDKLIVCGHQQERNARVWLDALAQAAGIDRTQLANQPGETLTYTLPQSGQGVSACAQQIAPTASAPPPEKNRALPASSEKALFDPLVVVEAEQTDDEKQKDALDNRRRLRRVIGRRDPEGAALGTLVHAALRRWLFTGNSLEALLDAEALMEGLVDQHERAATIKEAKKLLERFCADVRFAELDVAERHHEVPYAMASAALPTSGYIDLLYRTRDQKWRVVDFKTDDLPTAEKFADARSRYAFQVERYRNAVRALTGQEAEPELCFLNYAGKVRWERVI